MNRLDRYIFLQLLAPFGFFTLALAGILWLGQTLPLVELIIDNGRSGFIFLEFSVLILPNVLLLVLPVSAFIASLYAVNKLFGESEMVVIMSAGLSPMRIARPVFFYGMFVATAMYILVLALAPTANTRLADKIDAIRKDAVNSLLREKRFIHPEKGLTIFIRDSSKAGEIQGLFLNDQRDPAFPVTYSAQEALLLKDEDELRLVMSKGVMQRYSPADNTLNLVEFENFVFDLTSLLKRTSNRFREPIEFGLRELLDPQALIASGVKHPIGVLVAELHNRLAQPLLGLALPLLAAALLLTAKYRRSGFAVRIAGTSFLGLFVVTASLMVKSIITTVPALFWVAYIPAAGSLLYAATLLILATSRGRPEQGTERLA